MTMGVKHWRLYDRIREGGSGRSQVKIWVLKDGDEKERVEKVWRVQKYSMVLCMDDNVDTKRMGCFKC